MLPTSDTANQTVTLSTVLRQSVEISFQKHLLKESVTAVERPLHAGSKHASRTTTIVACGIVLEKSLAISDKVT